MTWNAATFHGDARSGLRRNASCSDWVARMVPTIASLSWS
jgi:hypothetical protein